MHDTHARLKTAYTQLLKNGLYGIHLTIRNDNTDLLTGMYN